MGERMGKKRNKRWNSCLMCFAVSFGAFCLSLPGLRAEGESDVNHGFAETTASVTADLIGSNRYFRLPFVL